MGALLHIPVIAIQNLTDQGAGQRVLLVDDTPANLEVLYQALAQEEADQVAENSDMAIWPSPLVSLRVNQSGRPRGRRSVGDLKR